MRRGRHSLALFGFCLASLLVRPAAAAFEVSDKTWEGTSELLDLAREELGRDRVEIVARIDWSSLSPRDALLILHPEVDLEYDEVSAFLRAGGRLAVLDDHGRADRLWQRFDIHRIRAPLQPAESLRNNPNLAIAVPAVQQVAGHEQGRHPVVADVQKVVTNHAAALTHPNLTPVLRIPARGEPDATIAVTGIIVNRGRLFSMTDPSVVINLMLRYPGNRAFARGLVRYLVEDDSWGPRQGKLVIAANRIDQTGHYGGVSNLSRDLREGLETALAALKDARTTGLPERAALVFSVLLALAAGAWVVLFSTRVYRGTLPRFAGAVPLVGQGGVAGRAAVLSAGRTPRALVLLELKSALEEGLCQRLGIEPGLSPAVLASEVARRGALSEKSCEKLKQMLAELASVENAVAASQPLRVSPQQVSTLRREVFEVLEEATQRVEAGA